MKIESPDAPAAAPDRLRRRLLLGLPGGLALSSPLALVACGGGGGDDGSEAAAGTGTSAADEAAMRAAVAAAVAKLPAVARSARQVGVTLPAGSGVAVASTNLVSANNVSQVAADGTAGIVVIDGAPQMSYLFDGRGRLLLMSLVEDGVRTKVDSRGTAEALLLLTSEAAYQGPAIEIALRRALADTMADTVVEPLKRAVEDAMSRGGIDAGDAPLMAALKTATLTLRGRTAMAPAGVASKGDVRAQAITVNPSGAASGVTVLSGEDFNTVRLQNQFRRRTHAWISRTGYVDAGAVRTLLPAPVPLTDFALDATNELSFDNLVKAVGDYVAEMAESLGFLGAYEAGNYVWTPVASAPVALPVLPETAEAATYQARVVGIGSSDGGTLSAAEATALEDIVGKTFWEDVIKPFLRTVVLPMISERIPNTTAIPFDSNLNALVINGLTDLSSLAIAGSYFPKTIAALKAGDARGVLNQFTDEFFTSNTFQNLLEIALRAFVQASQASWTLRDGSGALVGVNLLSNEDLARQNVARLKDGLGKLARVIQIIKVTALVGDYTAIAHDWNASTRISEFEIHASKAKVSLAPKPVVAFRLLGAAGKGTVTAKVEGLDAGVPPENVFLHWTATSRFGHLYKRGGADLDDFESQLTEPSHDYIPSGVEVDAARPDTITVTAFYRNPATRERLLLGSATAAVDVRDEFTLTVLPAQLQDVPADGDFSITALIKERLPAGATVAWTYSHSGVGSLGELPADANLQDSAAVFHAGSSEGAASVVVSAVVQVPASAGSPARSVTVKPKTARLRVKKGLKTVTVYGSWTTDVFYSPYTCAQCGPYGTPKDLVGYSAIAFAVVPKVGRFTSCAITLKSSDGPIAKSRSFGPNVFVGRDTEHGEQDRGGAVWLGLSGASGTVGDNGEGPPGAIAWFSGRFADLVVTAVYTLP